MLNRLRTIYRQEQFFPGFFGLFVNPFYFARRGLAGAMRQMSQKIDGDLLDIGCGTKPYQCLFNVRTYVGLDIDSPVSRKLAVADYFYDGSVFPFSNNLFDSVLCNQVLEHVFNPDDFLSEISRVLKPSGQLLLTVPFVWDEHEQPHDYARYSSFGLRFLLEKNGFVVKEHQKLGADATLLFQIANAYLVKVTQSWPRPARLSLTVTIVALINLVGLIAGKLLPSNPDLFLDHVVLAEKSS